MADMDPLTLAVPLAAIAGGALAAATTIALSRAGHRQSRPVRDETHQRELLRSERAALARAGYRSARWCVTLAPAVLVVLAAAAVYAAITAPTAMSAAVAAATGSRTLARWVGPWARKWQRDAADPTAGTPTR
jgi:hypothetical protein